MRWRYFFEDNTMMVFSHQLLPYEERAFVKAHGNIVSIENYTI